MSLKARMKKVVAASKDLKKETPREKAMREYEERKRKSEQMAVNIHPCSCGDLEACLKYAEVTSEETSNTLYEYRDALIEVAAMQRGEEPNFEALYMEDVLQVNIKKVYRYLEEKQVNAAVDPPGLENYEELKGMSRSEFESKVKES
ncbi:hypothetical protein [Priestia megaterium]|uniref:hypothetical protein n=1 Tax=Priestia megaterium TaxID=1404 RepID=UPI002E237675|nr:hypothetical protein [Priestia megaterium]